MSYSTARLASAVATSLVAFVSYLLSAAPSLTFWRASELAAAASVFGIPEPPVASLWLITARIAQLVIPGDAAGATALLSALCSAVTAGVVVLIVCALVERWFDDRDDDRRMPSIGGGVVAGLAFAWADSQWRAATVASTEPLAVLLVASSLLLTIRWSNQAAESWTASRLLAASFLLGLLAGVDVRLLAIAPALGAIVFLRVANPTPWNTGVAIAAALVGGWAFDRLATAWLPSVIDGSNWFVIIGVPVLLAILFGAWHATRESDDGGINVAAIACALALLGATTAIVIPVRGASYPPTNAHSSEVDAPVSRMVGVDAGSDVPFWPRRWSIDPERRRYQDRYGAWSPASIDDPMVASVGAELRFLWHYQLAHMYVRYILWNYVGRASDQPDAPPAWFSADDVPQHVQESGSLTNPFPVRFFALPLLLAVIGCISHFRRDPGMALPLALLFVLAGIGVAMSVSLQQPQPRERDSLYLASYFVLAIWIGIAAASLATRRLRTADDEDVDEGVDRDRIQPAVGMIAIALCLVAGPVNMLVGGWSTHDRSGSVIAWDYAYNLLQSCDSNAVLLTAGDNDTFPLTYLQDAEAIRRDVRVVNLSMANDPAYLRRLSREHRWHAAPLALSIVDTLPDNAEAIGVVVGPPEMISVSLDATGSSAFDSTRSAMTWVLRGPAIGGEGMHMLRLQEQVVVDLIRQHRFRRPIYFASSVANENRAGLDAFLRREGLALRITPTRQTQRGEAVDAIRTRRALLNPLRDAERFEGPHDGFKLRGLSRASSYLEAEERRVISMYRHLYLVLAERELDIPHNAAAVRTLLDAMERRIPSSVHQMPYWMSAGIASLYKRAGDTAEARRAAARAVDAVDAMGSDWRRHPHARVYHPIQIKAQMLALLGDYDRAIETYSVLQAKYPTDPHLRGQLEELRIERHLSRRDTASALAEIDAIIVAYSGAADAAMLNNASAFRELSDELRGLRLPDDGTSVPAKRRKKKRR